MATTEGIEGSYRLPSFERALVRDAMHAGVVSCAPETPLRTVAQIMAQRHIHSVVVTDLGAPEVRQGERSWGMVSDVDVLRASSGDLDIQVAREVAGTELPTVDVEETLARAAQVMAEHDVTHVMVVEGRGDHAVGVLSSLDIAGILAWGRA